MYHDNFSHKIKTDILQRNKPFQMFTDIKETTIGNLGTSLRGQWLNEKGYYLAKLRLRSFNKGNLFKIFRMKLRLSVVRLLHLSLEKYGKKLFTQ